MFTYLMGNSKGDILEQGKLRKLRGLRRLRGQGDKEEWGKFPITNYQLPSIIPILSAS
jgi:hypothetical protein